MQRCRGYPLPARSALLPTSARYSLDRGPLVFAISVVWKLLILTIRMMKMMRRMNLRNFVETMMRRETLMKMTRREMMKRMIAMINSFLLIMMRQMRKSSLVMRERRRRMEMRRMLMKKKRRKLTVQMEQGQVKVTYPNGPFVICFWASYPPPFATAFFFCSPLPPPSSSFLHFSPHFHHRNLKVIKANMDWDQFEPGKVSPSLLGLKDIGHWASWTVSTSKPGCGVAELRSEDTNLFWQSDGPQPHLINIHFAKRVFVKRIRIYLDYSQDESYTPTKIAVYAGTGYHDLQEVCTLEFNQPVGWQEVPLENVHADGILRAFLIQVCILSNHQNGKDTHVRGLQIYSPLYFLESHGGIAPTLDESNEIGTLSPVFFRKDLDDIPFNTKYASIQDLHRQANESYQDEERAQVWERIEKIRINAERRANGEPLLDDTPQRTLSKHSRALRHVELEKLETPRPPPKKRPRPTIDWFDFDPATMDIR
ncbi:hypothetical protein AA313_de0208103 [Arthrobotrys entomopaga]|nr:hypothetical protein AA313_de0208103 [Arthrobotrys entomopaga]